MEQSLKKKHNGRVSVLSTPFGDVKVFLDGQPIETQHYSILDRAKGVDDACDCIERLLFEYKKDGKPHQLKAVLETDEEGYCDGGERFEAFTFDKDDMRLTLGVEGEAGNCCGWYDYDVFYEKNTLIFDITPETKSQWFSFGVAWGKCNTDDSADTWYGAQTERMDILFRNGADKPDYHAIHRHCTNNHEALSKATKCGCFYCCTIFNPAEIEEWVEQDDSAVCPHCGVDSIIPESETGEYELTEELLKEMYKVWFE